MIRAFISDMFETLITQYRSPQYFSAQMAADLGLPPSVFSAAWGGTESARTTGSATLEGVLERIMRENGVRSQELLDTVARKRRAAKESCFRTLEGGIMPMLAEIRSRGLKTAVISNCFSEEAPAIRQSALAEMFDVLTLSFEQGVQKPDHAIYERCLGALGVSARECVYLGDGGSGELEAAHSLGMHAVQAGWYLAERGILAQKRLPQFPLAEKPADILTFIERL